MEGIHLDVLRAGVNALEQRLQELVQAREKAEGNVRVRKDELDETFKSAVTTGKEEVKARLTALEEALSKKREAIQKLHDREMERIDKAYNNSAGLVRTGRKAEDAHFDKREAEAKEEAAQTLARKHARLAQDVTSLVSELDELRSLAERFKKRTDYYVWRLGVRPEEAPAIDLKQHPSDPEKLMDAVGADITNDVKLLDGNRRRMGFRFALSSFYLFPVIFLIFAAAAAIFLAQNYRPELFIQVTAGSLVLLFALLFLIFRIRHRARKRACDLIRAIDMSVKGTILLLKHYAANLQLQSSPNSDKLLEEKIGLMSEISRKYRTLREKADEVAEAKMDRLARRRDALAERAGRRRDRRLKDAGDAVAGKKRELEALMSGDSKERRSKHADEAKAIVEAGRQEVAQIAQQWKESVRACLEVGREACRIRDKHHPRWADPRWKDYKMSKTFPESVHVGDLCLDLRSLLGELSRDETFAIKGESDLHYPVGLSYPGRGGLLLSVTPEARTKALEVLFSTVLRIVSTFPPAKAKFLIFDPVGLGQSFSALMHLADYDESLVGGRIWTEMPHIERKLSELTEHVEKVIQKYLRNRFPTIDDYNRTVGTMAEAYNFLVICDFPVAFSDLAMERLSSIITSGARCGVYPLILQDVRHKLPSTMDLSGMQKNGLALEADADGFRLADNTLRKARLQTEKPPEGETLTSLLHVVGRQCVDAERVEVPFENATPPEGQLWTSTTELGVKIPLGMAGADRLQYLELGRGTSQHALIAGKTGSGKSTLFHVMIANSALWHSPHELELYLIDFKKGVEFKRFANHDLPHARVVAIESDREFGLSVLRRIDQELTVRAELYRKSGVQDFGSYRRHGKGRYLPRTLLMIDEFQEFFVEEDSVAQEAALLLDRIVRQGRAFGIHVILGSQTLGGSYSLAKTTLGQMGIRIALQCNEADSYLILSDDNAAARLLSRPGEAIYNNMSGMVEGNNPFQIVWLPDELEDRFLKQLRARADKDNWTPPEPMTVFEGNVPADIRKNALLNERLAKPFDLQGAAPRFWVGEANAIKGPTEVSFIPQGGSNLLMVGQARESALTIMLSSVVGLAAAYPPGGARFILLDGSSPELGYTKMFEALAAAIPHELKLTSYAQIPQTIEELGEEVKARLEGAREADHPVFLLVYDLQRFRKLRQGDEFDFSSGADEKISTDRHFSNILSEGPVQRVHTLIWCDSLANVNRTFSRKTLREFEMRILFQMSASDSSELIDSPLGNRLGLHRGLLYLEEQGTTEKFRPYALPGMDWLSEVGGLLTRARTP